MRMGGSYKMSKNRYFTLDNILKYDVPYYMIIGEKSNGKSFAVLNYILDMYFQHDCEWSFGAIRRYDDEFKGANGASSYFTPFESFPSGNLIEKKSGGKWNHVRWWRGQWLVQKVDSGGNVLQTNPNPLGTAFPLTKDNIHGGRDPRIKTIFFDEFLTRQHYLIDEFVSFQITVSNIIGDRDDVKIFMCGNTFNKYSPYFAEMGLKHISKMPKGSIDLYSYSSDRLKVAVEYSDFPAKKKKSDFYFAFDNPKLQMITKGEWQIGLYPHYPYKEGILPKDVIYRFYIIFEESILEGEIINKYDEVIAYIHRKTTPIKDDIEYPVYQLADSPKINYATDLRTSQEKVFGKISKLFMTNKVFYQDNDVGDIVKNYFDACSKLTVNG